MFGIKDVKTETEMKQTCTQ